MLTRVKINNYRGLREVDVPLKPLTVLIGPNNTGKSSLLSAIQLLGTTPVKGSGPVGVSSADLWRFQPTAIPTVVGIVSGSEEIRVIGGPAPIAGGRTERIWIRDGSNSQIVPINLFNNSVFMPAMESAGSKAKEGIPQIDDRASNVPAFLDALLRKDRDRFFRVLDTLRKLIPGLVDLNIDTPSPENRRIELVLENEMKMDAKLASYGVKLMIFFVALANHPTPPMTALFEEPETGVHPKRLEDIVKLLIGLSEGRFADRPTQVILTTHSPYLLDCIDPEKHQVLVLQRDPEGACTARPVDTGRLSHFLPEFMLGEVWLNQDEAGLLEKAQ